MAKWRSEIMLAIAVIGILGFINGFISARTNDWRLGIVLTAFSIVVVIAGKYYGTDIVVIE
jgi:hypothetical protein